MKVKVQFEAFGEIIQTPKGYIRQLLIMDNVGEKCVIKLFSKESTDLKKDKGEMVVKADDFCFMPNKFN